MLFMGEIWRNGIVHIINLTGLDSCDIIIEKECVEEGAGVGKYNSSIYRVRPLMEVIKLDYNAFLKLLTLVKIPNLNFPQSYGYDGENCAEKQLKPSKRHLSALITYMATKNHTATSVNNEKRRALYFSNPDTPNSRAVTCQEALAALEEGYNTLSASSRAWYVFEGFTSPDIFIEGDDYVIVCEGKWTEPHITVKTTNLSSDDEYRNQMIRHIQGALNYTNKKVYAFYIVDKGCGYEDELTAEEFAMQVDRETIKIPAHEKARIIDAFCGYTTWQDIQQVIPAVVFKGKEDIK